MIKYLLILFYAGFVIDNCVWAEPSKIKSVWEKHVTSTKIVKAGEFYKKLVNEHSTVLANTSLEQLQKQVIGKKNFDNKDFWYAKGNFENILCKEPDDIQAWYLLIRSLYEIQQSNNNDEYGDSIESSLILSSQYTKNTIDKAVILWTAGTMLPDYKALKTEALKLASEADIQKRVDEWLDRYPQEFAPYDIDVPQKSDVASACVAWTYPLLKKQNFHYEDYLSIKPGIKDIAVIARGNKLCIEGLNFGQNYQVTFKAGFPGISDVKTDRDQSLDIYVNHRKSTIRFRERGYILPSHGPQLLPFHAVNVAKVKVRIIHVPERNIKNIQASWFSNSLSPWETKQIANDEGEVIWQGVYTCDGAMNQTATSGLPIDVMMGKKLLPGVYLVEASLNDGTHDSGESVTQPLVISDIGLSTYKGHDGLHIYARSLLTAQALANVDIRLIARNNRELAHFKTDQTGYGYVTPEMTHGLDGNTPAFIEATIAGEQFSILNLRTEAFDLSDRGAQGRKPNQGIDGYIYSERCVYRPGEVVRLMTLLRDTQGKAVQNIPLTLKIFRPDGVEVKTLLLKDSGAGSYYHEYTPHTSAPTGLWMAAIYVNPNEAEIARTSFKVDDFVPPRIEVSTTTNLSIVKPHEPCQLAVQAQYYFGPPGANLKVQAESKLVKAEQFFESWKDYSFGLEEEPWTPQKFKLPVTHTNEQGKALLSLDIQNLPTSTNLLAIETAITIFENGGKGRSVTKTVPLWHQDYVIGISPRFKDKVTTSQSKTTFDIIAVNQEGDLLDKENISYTLYEEQHDYVWYRYGHEWRYEVVIRDQIVTNGTMTLNNQKSVPLTVDVNYGRYRLEVMDNKTGIASSIKFSAGWCDTQDAPDRPDKLDVQLDQASYKDGDKARVYIKTPFAGQLVMTVAGQKFKQIYAGPIGKEGITLDVAIKDTLLTKPGSYLLATVYRPGEAKAQQVPARAIGLAWLDLKKSIPAIPLEIKVPSVIKPKQKFDVIVNVPAHRPQLRLTVAVVDEAILSLIDYKSPNPYEHFFSQIRLNYDLRDNYGYLINPYGVKPGSFSVGGDALNSRQLARLAARPFKVVSLFSGVIETKGQTEIRVPFDIPEISTQLRVMAVAWDDEAMGQADTKLFVREDVDLYLSLPRFLTIGDQLEAPLIVKNVASDPGSYTITLESNLGKLNETFTLAKDQQVQFPATLTAGIKEHVDTMTTVINGKDNFTLSRSWDIATRSSVMDVAMLQYGLLEPHKTLTIDVALLKDFQASHSLAELSLGSTPDYGYQRLIKELINYPYGCIEQTSSRLIAALHRMTIDKKTVNETRVLVDNLLNQLLAAQRLDGSFTLWSTTSYSGDPWLTLYVADVLTVAQQHNVQTPDALKYRLANWIKDRQQRASYYASGNTTYDLALQSYAEYIVAKSGTGNLGQLRYFADNHQGQLVSRHECALIAAAYSYYGQADQATKWFNKALAASEIKKAKHDEYSAYSSRVRDTALLLSVLAETTKSHPQLLALANELTDLTRQQKFFSTQEQAWLIRAAAALKDKQMSFKVTVDGKDLEQNEAIHERYTNQDLKEKSIQIINNSEQPLHYSLSLQGKPISLEKLPQQGFDIDREIYSIDGKIVDLKKLKAGELYIVKISGRRLHKDIRHVTIVDLLPACFDIENAQLTNKTAENYDWLGTLTAASRLEKRDDRFFAAFELQDKDDFTVAYLVRVTSQGRFTYPATYVEALYQSQYFKYGHEHKIYVDLQPVNSR